MWVCVCVLELEWEWMKVIEWLLGFLRLYTILYSEFDLIQIENKVKSKYKPLVIAIVTIVVVVVVNNNMIIDRCNPWVRKREREGVKDLEQTPIFNIKSIFFSAYCFIWQLFSCITHYFTCEYRAVQFIPKLFFIQHVFVPNTHRACNTTQC